MQDIKHYQEKLSKELYREEHDSMGTLKVPANALFAAQTQRAIKNFKLSDLRMPQAFIKALLNIKHAAAMANHKCGVLDEDRSRAIGWACEFLTTNYSESDFPVDVFQTGSGTSTNMNVNEVVCSIANDYLKTQLKKDTQLHPNDHVNLSQSSNDVIPSAINLSCAIELQRALRPSLLKLTEAIEQNILRHGETIKNGRTHLMDALPIRCGQELSAWSAQIKNATQRLDEVSQRVAQLPLGGTAVGTGVNCPANYPQEAMLQLSELVQLPLSLKPNFFEGISSQDTAVELSGQLKVLAVTLMKIANDLRWMNSGPNAGLNELQLKALQPGSSIMPGKVNPVIPEAVAMVAAQVIGNDTSITVAAQSGNFQLNTMLPIIAYNLLQSIKLLSNACTHLSDKVFSGLEYRQDKIEQNLAKNPILVTALNPIMGYEKSARIAKEAFESGRPIIDVAEEMTDLSRTRLQELLNPKNLV